MNYLYPESGIIWYGHHNIYYELARYDKLRGKFLGKLFDPDAGTLSELLKEIRDFKTKNPNGHIIISSEAIFSLKYKLEKYS